MKSINVKGRRIDKPQGVGPKDFLAKLGIERPPKGGVFTQRFWDDIKARGGDPEVRNSGDRFQPAVGDTYFIDPAIGRRVLSEDYERYIRHIKEFTEVRGFPQKPRAIAEIGCGPGVLSPWLGHQYPEATVSAFDWSERAVEIGRVFASELNFRNVDFSQKSYEELADGEVGKFDLVIAYHAFDLKRGDATNDRAFTYSELSESDLDELAGQIIHATRAIARLLTDDGVAVICGNWDDVGLQCLFHSIRQAGLGTNWSSTFWKGGTSNDSHYIFCRRNTLNIGANAWEDARAFLACGEYYGREVKLDHKLLESYVDLFTPGETIAHLEFQYDSGGTHRLRLLKRAGLLLLEESNTLGFRKGALHTMASITEFFPIIHQYETEWQTKGSGKITRNEKAERLMQYLEALGVVREIGEE